MSLTPPDRAVSAPTVKGTRPGQRPDGRGHAPPVTPLCTQAWVRLGPKSLGPRMRRMSAAHHDAEGQVLPPPLGPAAPPAAPDLRRPSPALTLPSCCGRRAHAAQLWSHSPGYHRGGRRHFAHTHVIRLPI